MSADFYRLRAPIEWATTLDRVSYSSLTAIERCPRQWQLTRSRWEGCERFPARAHPATVEGRVVHETLDRLFRALSLRGAPAVGTVAFREVVAEVDVMGSIRRALDAHERAMEAHPRRASMRVPTDARSLANKVARLFHAEYASVTAHPEAPQPRIADEHPSTSPLEILRRRGALTEWPVEHPSLSLHGVVDLLRRDAEGTHVVDFKTGAPKPEYETQLKFYALMWWRMTDDVAVSLELRHPRGRVGFPVDASRLRAVEGEVAARIAAVRASIAKTPADARPGEACRFCDVRAFCDDYWAARAGGTAPFSERDVIDAEIVVPERVDPNGFESVRHDGRRLPVVYDDEAAAVHGPFNSGEILRGLGLRVTQGAIRITAGSEVFHRDRAVKNNDTQ